MKDSRIQWTDHTFNPWIGCTKVSEGCSRCYAETLDRSRFSRMLGGGTKERPISHWGSAAPRHRTSASAWKQPFIWNDLAADGTCDRCGTTWAGVTWRTIRAKDVWSRCRTIRCGGRIGWRRARVFFSLGDWLDNEVPFELLLDFLQLIHNTPNLQWLLLTKRPENFFGRMEACWKLIVGENQPLSDWIRFWGMDGKPPGNVWFGVSVENQIRADERIPKILKIPARVRFLSVEPMLEQIDLNSMDGIHWAIFGGESGHGARPCNIEWIRDGIRQCRAAGVKVFCKQVGSNSYVPAPYGPIKDRKGGDPSEWPEDLRIRELP